jgi:two-component system sensor histidine kinase/response regulator
MVLAMRRTDLLILVMAGCFALTVVGMCVWLLLLEHQRSMARAEAATRDFARIIEQYVSRILETSDLVARDVAHYTAEQGGVAALRDDETAHQYLVDLSRRTTGDYIMIVDSAGFPAVLTIQHPTPSIDLSDRAWFRAHAAGSDIHVG